MATHYYQNQEQDDLMADFDAPRKEASERSDRRRRTTYLDEWVPYHKPKPKKSSVLSYDTNVAREVRRPNTDQAKGFNEKENTYQTGSPTKYRGHEEFSTEVSGRYQGVSTDDLDEDCCASDSFNVLLEEIKNVITEKASVVEMSNILEIAFKYPPMKLLAFDQAGFLPNFDSMTALTLINAILESCAELFELASEIPKHEEELKYITAAFLVCYGGSWTTLAGIFAAAEAFEIEKVAEKARQVGMILLAEDDESQHEVSAREIKACFKSAGLHIALMVSVVLCPSWAEICISFAFASKFSYLVSLEDLLKKGFSTPEMPNTEVDDYFGLADPAWFELLSSITCIIMSLIIFGCFPRLVTAIYMGYLGFNLTAKALIARSSFGIPFVLDSENLFTQSVWMKKTTQYYVWAFVSFMAIWQSMSGYTGDFEFLSWLMFLLPVVQMYNMLYEYPCDKVKNTD